MMKTRTWFAGTFLACAALATLDTTALALTGTQVGPSGATYASAGMQCGVNPVAGMAPVVHAGLYNPKKNASATVLLNGVAVATVSFSSPDALVWLGNGPNTVTVSVNRRVTDTYSFDATPVNPSQANVCMPDTSANVVSGSLEYAASLKSYATITPGCALNGRTGQAQPFINLFDNGSWLLNVSVNNVALTQLNGTTRPHTPVFLGPGLNVISAANGAASTDYYVRDGGTGTCTLP